MNSLSRDQFQLPERFFSALGAAIVFGLFLRSGVDVTAISALGLFLSYLIGVYLSNAACRVRMLVNYFAVCVLYGGSSFAIDALRLPLHHAQLLAWDRTLWGETPGVRWQGAAPGWLNDLLSACYLSYHVYLHWLLVDVLCRSDARRSAYSRVLFTGFAVGFFGYFAFPAGDPRVAHPELYTLPVTGGLMTRFNQWIVGNFAAKYDAFPSVHILVTSLMLTCDWRWNRTRMWCMLVPSLLMVASTLLLRLHYSVDLIAGAVLALGVLVCVRFPEIRIDD